MWSLVLLLGCVYLASCLPPPHPAVVAVRHEEEQLHPILRSPALYNPHLQELLELTTLLHRGENPVYEREADNVNRQEIYNILTHAGFVPRRPLHHQPDPFHQPHQRKKSGSQNQHHNPHSHHNDQHQDLFHAPPFFGNPEFLQHL